MDFGKISSVQELNTVSFSLPPEDQRTSQLLCSLKQRSKLSLSAPLFYLGCPIWGKKEWVGKIYPAKTPQRDYLRYYARQFNTIELNTTFYRIPDASTVDRWKSLVPDGFMFSPKVFQGISRFETLTEIPSLTRRFCEAVARFDDHLGTSFLQLPPMFGPRWLLVLRRFLGLLPQGFRLAVEFRHPDWFSQGRLIDSVFELLAEKGVSTVITDVAGRRDVLHPSLTTPTAMVRFVGNALHPSDFERINHWVERLGAWMEKGVDQIYFFVHEPDEVGTLDLINYLTQEWSKRYSLRLKSWDPTLAEPSQRELFKTSQPR